jgi:hypothetical protein
MMAGPLAGPTVLPDEETLMQGTRQRAEIQRRPLYLTASLFAAAFGVAGQAQAWSTVTRLASAPDWPGNVLWIVAAAAWLITVAGYLANVAAQRRWKPSCPTDIRAVHPTDRHRAHAAGHPAGRTGQRRRRGCVRVRRHPDGTGRRLDHRELDHPRR